MDLINFFREDLGEILGVYHDEDKIFLARLTDTLEIAEFTFEIDLNNKSTQIEQLAEKIKLICDQRAWKISRVGLILRDGTAATFQTEFKNIPESEIKNAVKIWATANVGKEARYTSIKVGEEIFMEALPVSIVEEYISAFEKSSLTLCAITEFPKILADEDRPPTPFNRAVFAVDIVKNNKSPNFFSAKISTWNFKRIALTAAAIFFIALAGFSAKLGHDYYHAATRAETAHNRFNAQDEYNLLKSNFDADTAQIKQFDAAISKQNINSKNLNALVKIGKIFDGKIILDKIKTTGETFELEGVTESPDALKLYLNRLKNFISPKVKLKNSTEDDGQIIFSISIIFS